ncbi:hypothetical protein [Roseiconus lacunae]|uniref:hypothetical protein n=1 Tax=Roseiconus lacunae TaxID=2605694 RepID=UPI0011F0D9A4|nr:hypothetical protein [Roseiconus lacunae]
MSLVAMNLEPILLEPQFGPLPENIAAWIAAAATRAKGVDCFDYVPSNPEVLYGYIRSTPGRSYCEWGSGIGIGVGIAALLGKSASGIEIDEELVHRSRGLFQSHSIDAHVTQGSYLDLQISPKMKTGAEVVYAYCWPGQVNELLRRFIETMPRGSTLLLAEGAERITPLRLV